MHYVPLLIDKSAFQQLAPREAKWLFHHFRVNFPPVFFAEIIADLNKQKPTTASAEGDVQMLARKMASYSIDTNGESFDLVRSELHGAGRVPMKGVTIEQRAQEVVAEDGSRGLFVDQVPTQEMIARWTDGDFSNLERDAARVWRDGISTFKLEEVYRSNKIHGPRKFVTPREVGQFVDQEILGTVNDFQLMTGTAVAYGISPSVIRRMIQSWEKYKRPSFSIFLPYSYYCLRLELYFLVALSHQVISTRDSNRIDIEYFKYLPFTRVFASSDALHISNYDQFAMPFNCFVSGTDLKVSLREIADHWDGLSDEIRAQGTAHFANYPPVSLDNAVTKLYDRVIPSWRKRAAEPKIEITPEMSEKLMEHLKPMMDAIERQRKK